MSSSFVPSWFSSSRSFPHLPISPPALSFTFPHLCFPTQWFPRSFVVPLTVVSNHNIKTCLRRGRGSLRPTKSVHKRNPQQSELRAFHAQIWAVKRTVLDDAGVREHHGSNNSARAENERENRRDGEEKNKNWTEWLKWWQKKTGEGHDGRYEIKEN